MAHPAGAPYTNCPIICAGSLCLVHPTAPDRGTVAVAAVAVAVAVAAVALVVAVGRGSWVVVGGSGWWVVVGGGGG